MKPTRPGTVSNHVHKVTLERKSNTSSASLQSEVLRHKEIVKQKAEMNRKMQKELAAYGKHTLKQAQEMRADNTKSAPAAAGFSFDLSSENPLDHDQSMQDLDAVRSQLGAETQATDIGEDMVHAIRDFMYLGGTERRYNDTRTWRERVERATTSWDELIDGLADAYLGWKYPLPADPEARTSDQMQSSPSATSTPGQATSEASATLRGNSDHAAGSGEYQGANNGEPRAAASAREDVPTTHPSSAERDGSWDVALDIIDIISLERRALFRRSATQRTAIAIAESGYLPTSPQHPTLAISFRTLEYFRRLRLRKSSYSVEAFAKTMCDLYGIPYRRRWRTAISDTYDVYLAILRVVDKRLMAYLGRDTANWRVKHACTACNFKLEGEEDLGYDRICCMDGNNSLKRIAKIGDREIADKREFTESDYYLLADYVDQFKDEVKRSRNKDAAKDDDDGAWTDVEDSDDEGDAHGDEGDPTDFAGADDMLRQCTKNWKSAARDETKKMWGIFDETGIFAAACRHGFILWVMDMVKSGELAKYALAIVAKALDVFEDRILFGYDIGCTFNGTILASSLGPKFTSRGCRCCVNAFHGYSHSHSCQTINHPSVIKGAGLDDMEGMERIFSSSNELAPITRYSSKYHRRMNIDRHLYQWDEDKYANLATMLYNNYKQALDILANDVPVVDEWLVLNNCTLADLENWDKEEKTYFATVGKVTEADAVALEYVARLQELWRLQDRSATASSAFVTSIPEDYALAAPKERTADAKYRQDVSQTLKKETEMRLLREKRDAALRDVIALELQLGLDSASRWTPTTPKFVETAQFLAERDYHVALEQLQRLVVQRLFELHTMNISHTAYKIRTQIAKSLQRRSKAIRAAVNAYNKAAAALKNPRPPLDWSKVTHYAFLEEFELLRDTRNDLAGKRWAETTTRPIIKKARRIARAREEIRRCNVEVRRVHSAIIVENEELETAVRKSRDERNPIWGALVDYATRRRRVNARLLAIIGHIYDLPGFSGHRTPGVRKGTTTQVPTTISPATATEIQSEAEEIRGDSEDTSVDDADLGAAATVLEFATNLT